MVTLGNCTEDDFKKFLQQCERITCHTFPNSELTTTFARAFNREVIVVYVTDSQQIISIKPKKKDCPKVINYAAFVQWQESIILPGFEEPDESLPKYYWN